MPILCRWRTRTQGQNNKGQTQKPKCGAPATGPGRAAEQLQAVGLVLPIYDFELPMSLCNRRGERLHINKPKHAMIRRGGWRAMNLIGSAVSLMSLGDTDTNRRTRIEHWGQLRLIHPRNRPLDQSRSSAWWRSRA